ncbi:hypothetical protein [Mesoaciditoga sp.]
MKDAEDVKSMKAIVERVRKIVESDGPTRLLLKAKGTLVKRYFLKKLIESVEEKDASYDLFWLNRDGEKVKVEDARKVADFLSYSPSIAKHKYIVSEEFTNSTPEAASALLKITEEPPEYAVFIFFTSSFSQIFSTIKSRFISLNLNIKTESLMEKEKVDAINASELKFWIDDVEHALYISENVEKLDKLLVSAVDVLSIVEIVKSEVLSSEETLPFELEFLFEKLLLFLREEEVVEVYQALKSMLNPKNSLSVFNAFLEAALVIVEDLVILKKTSYWQALKRPNYVNNYVEMEEPSINDVEWILKIREKKYRSKVNVEVGIFLLLTKFATLKRK